MARDAKLHSRKRRRARCDAQGSMFYMHLNYTINGQQFVVIDGVRIKRELRDGQWVEVSRRVLK